MNLIPITYHNKKYPQNIKSDIDEVAGNFDKEKIIVCKKYSLHTEYSYMKRKLNSDFIDEFHEIKKSHKDNIPQLWKSKKWALEFVDFIVKLVGNNKSPEIIEIHPPFNDYCSNISDFFEIYEVFEIELLKKYPNVEIFIENRCGSFYKGGKFIISNGKSIIEFLKGLQQRNLKLKLVLDYPQVFSADLIKMNDIKLDKIITFNSNIKQYISLIGGFHLWGKRKSESGRWASHTGDLNSFFNNDSKLKDEFISSLVNTFDDEKVRYFVPEVNSGEEDLHSIIMDLLKYNINFID